MLNQFNSTNIFDLLILDVETVPQVSTFSELSPLFQSLWSDKISKTMPENIGLEESWLMRAGIMAEFGKIICISTGFFCNDEQGALKFRIKSIYDKDEKLLLEKFKDLVIKFHNHNQKFLFCGHNIREFDIPYICRRMLVNHITLPLPLQIGNLKPWEVNMVDTLLWWRFGDYKNYISLNLLANILGVPTPKSDMDGSMVQHVYYKENDLKRIVNYCEKDVVAVANIIRRFNNQMLLKDGELIFVEEPSANFKQNLLQ